MATPTRAVKPAKKESLIKIPTQRDNGLEPFVLPAKKSQGAHCFDIACSENFAIYPNECKIVETNLKFQIPAGYAVLLRERSSTVCDNFIIVAAGDIDSDYRGHVKLVFVRMPRISIMEAIRHCRGRKKFKLLNLWNKACYIWNYYRARNRKLYFKEGTRLAQAELVKVIPGKFVEANKLNKTKRGSGGFGSTGK